MSTRRRAARAAASPPKPDPVTYEVGTWAGRPNYGCQFCTFRTLDGAALVVAHIATFHREQATLAEIAFAEGVAPGQADKEN